MAGTKGQITRAKGGKQKTVFLSDVFRLFRNGRYLHITFQKGKQHLNIAVTKKDGLLYEVMLAFYRYGKALP